MSDGPHRSLPMRRHWKVLAERAANVVFSPEQVCEALPFALKCEIGGAALKKVCEILVDSPRQRSLFDSAQTERLARLEGVRAAFRGSAATNVLVDSAVVAVRGGMSGEGACRSAVLGALDETTRSAMRSIEEHYQREATSERARYTRDRLDATRKQCDFDAVTRDLLAPDSSNRTPKLSQRSGIDEGPEL